MVVVAIGQKGGLKGIVITGMIMFSRQTLFVSVDEFTKEQNAIKKYDRLLWSRISIQDWNNQILRTNRGKSFQKKANIVVGAFVLLFVG